MALMEIYNHISLLNPLVAKSILKRQKLFMVNYMIQKAALEKISLAKVD